MSQLTQVNPKETIIAVNGSGGAFVPINSTKFARYVEIAECAPGGGSFTGANFAPQGINYEKPDDNFAQQYPLLPGETFPDGDNNWKRDKAAGLPAGMTDPAGQSIPAVTYCKMRSATVTATQVRLREWS